MATFWHQMPFVRIILPLVIGIIAYPFLALNLLQIVYLLALTGFCLFVFQVSNKKIMNQYIQGIFLSVILFFCGALALSLKFKHQKQNHYSNLKSTYLLVELNQNPIPYSSGIKAESLVIIGIDSLKQQIPCQGKLMLYFKTDSLNPIPKYGDQLLIKSSFLEISAPMNPNAFDYKAYQARKGIFYQQYLKPNSWVLVNKNKGIKILAWAYTMQEKIQLILNQYLTKPEDIGISEALLYGYDKDIDDDLLDAYSKTGTLHVLAVSGMHVGMIFMLLSLLFKPLEKIKKAKPFIGLLNLLGIWAYSILCGLSPSILRATVMFSFVLIGQLIKRTGNPINSLAASAVALVWFDPEIIYNVGFQLSYAAVLGILIVYQELYFLLTFKQRLLDEIWKICSVSISAQVLTMPMSIYYFHQIPSYFLPANLIIIPLTSALIYLGIALLILSPITFLSNYIGKLISLLIQFTNFIAKEIAAMPGAYIDSILWNPIHILSYYLILLSMGIYLSKRDLFQLKFCLCLVLSLQTFSLIQTTQKMQQKQLTIYHVKNGLAIELVTQNKAYFWLSPNCLPNSKAYKNAIYPNQLQQGILESTTCILDSLNHFYKLPTKHTLFIWQSVQTPVKLSIETLLITGSKYQNITNMLNQNKVVRVVLDANLPTKKRHHLKKYLEKFKIPSHDIAENGAFEVSL